MLWLRLIYARLYGLLRRGKLEREMEQELHFHILMRARDIRRSGIPEDSAEREARRRFGNLRYIKEECREIVGGGMLETLWRDLRFGARLLVRRPGFTLIAVLTLALGIGANTAVFSVLDALLLRPLPGVAHPDQLVAVEWHDEGTPVSFTSQPNYADLRRRNTVLAGLAAFARAEIDLSTGDAAERVAGDAVSGNYFAVLGVTPARGRMLVASDEVRPEGGAVAVISDALWRSRFGADEHIVGQVIRLNGRAFTVVGVAGDGFTGTELVRRTDVWVPIAAIAELKSSLYERSVGTLTLFGRLAPGVTLAQAQAEMSGLARGLKQEHAHLVTSDHLRLFPGLGMYPGARAAIARFVGLLLAVASLVLLIACANVGSLLLARATVRRREIALRIALGASRARLIRQLLTESALLAALGGALGVCLASCLRGPILRMVLHWSGGVFPPATLNDNVLLFTLLVSLATGLLCGLIPALQTTRPDLVPALKTASPGRDGDGPTRLHRALMTCQVALSFLVLVCAGLLVRTLQEAEAIDPGFKTDQVLIMSVDLGRQGYTEERAQEFYGQLLDRVTALRGVRSASWGQTVPLGGPLWVTCFAREGHQADRPRPMIGQNVVSPGYFATMDIPLVAGRDFSARDRKASSPVVIINETLARNFFPGQNPIGRRVFLPMCVGPARMGPALEIIGVAGDTKQGRLHEEPRPHAYVPTRQRQVPVTSLSIMILHVRMEADADLSALAAAVRAEGSKLDRDLPLYDVKTLAEQVRGTLADQRNVSTLVGAFGLIALLLASIGLYAAMTYWVGLRTHEIGIRLALGAQPRALLGSVIGQGMFLTAIGIALGLLAAIASTRLLSSMLQDVSATDPLTFAAVTLVLAASALIACYLPARRATRADPMAALRSE